ncbi:MAG: GtrA family protein [Eubacteriaceae bacterium]|nr:GtrA family protein [Eubacteriaceae bacterium]
MALYRRFRHLINYGFFGCVTTGVNWAAYALMAGPLGMDYRISNVLAWFISVCVAYATNRRWVFEGDDENITREIFRFFAARGFTGAVEILLLPALVSWGMDMSLFGVENFVAKITVTVINIILNYILSRLFVFKGARR